MKMLSIRQWMIAGMLIFFLSAALFNHVADMLDQRLSQPSARQQAQRDEALAATQREIAANAANWHDATWQTSLRARLDALGSGALIRDPSGAEIFRAGPVGSGNGPPWQAAEKRQTTVVDGGNLVGAVELSVPPRNGWLQRAAGALSVVLALLFVRWQMGRYMVRPLEAMGRAARRIAGGDLDFVLPETRVREVANVREAFEAMGAGLRESIGRQAALEEERRFFVGAIAHDLRTPLFALRGSLVGLEQGLATSPEKAARYVAVCRQKADQLDRLVSDLFDYTKAEYLEQTLRREEVALRPLLAGTVDGLLPRARAKGVTVTLVAEADDRPVFVGDAHLLERAVENLLDNALRHTPAGGEIVVRWHAEAERVTFTIADTGPGIAARDLPHLFDPLYRGEVSRNRETGGVGLGLTIARRILRAHGGDLTATNRASGGAEFTGWLPLRTGVLATEHTAEQGQTLFGVDAR
jgi:signal transduction histidine kinase